MFTQHPFASFQETIIGNDVWIGSNVMIVAGVRIGDGAVIGGGAIVTRDVPPYAIFAGVPARLIRYRFSEEIRNRLLVSEWWNLDTDLVSKLDFTNVATALSQLEGIARPPQ